MAVDARNKRFSLLGFGLPIPRVMANPDGTIAAADRAQLLFLYAGIAAAESATWTVQAPAASAWGNQSPGTGVWTVQTPNSGSWA